MEETRLCGNCGATLSPGAEACPECHVSLSSNVSVKSGGVLARIGAGLVDLAVMSSCLALVVIEHSPWWLGLVVIVGFVFVGYVLHGSLGKSLFGLSVEVTPRWKYFVRETVGKLASFLIFGIGFLMIFGKEGLALHDLIAKSRVIRVKRVSPTIQGIRTLLLVAAVGVVAFLGAHYGSQRATGANSTATPSSAAVSNSLDAITRQIPAVLTIYCYDRQEKLSSQGSGFLISGDGVGVTNFHVLQSAYRAEAELGDGRIYQVLRIDAFDRGRDIAVLQIGRKMNGQSEWPSGLPFLTIGSSQGIAIGDRVATVSSPEGLSNSVTDGLVSAVRQDDPSDSLIQFTAPISPGSSGGPVFDISGKVIAVNVSQFAQGQNLNFAIPIEAVAEVRKREVALGFDDFRDSVSTQSRRSRAPLEQASAQQSDTGDTKTPTTLNGLYAGVLRNDSSNTSAYFGVLVRENGDGVVEGCMGVKKPLYGSGPLRGTTDSEAFHFVVDSGGYTITFDGAMKGKEISGTYSVSPMNGATQEGEFDAERGKEKSAPAAEASGCPTDEDMNSP